MMPEMVATILSADYAQLSEEDRKSGKIFYILDSNDFYVNDTVIAPEMETKRHNCEHCGAPNQSGVCDYCGSVV